MITKFEAISNPNRRKIIKLLLKRKKMTPNELLKYLDIKGPGLSSHLNVLENAKLVRKNRNGNNLVYYIDEKGLKQLHYEYANLFQNNLIGLPIPGAR